MKFLGSFPSKLPKIGTTIFSVMGKLATETGAINLSQGFPNFESNPELIDLVTKYMKQGCNQYAPMPGIIELREAISKKIFNSYSLEYHPDSEITVTAGATQAIFTAITAVVKEGDEVIIFTPAYDCYAPAVELNGGKPIYIQLKLPDYSINWKELKTVLNRKTKMIIINTPHNPSGSILSAGDMLKLEKLTNGSDVIILSDEVYEHILFDGYEHQSVARFPKLAERSFIVASFGKTFHNTGWKMGYCLASKNLMKEFRKVHQFNVFSCNTPMQYALADFITKEDNYTFLGAFYQKKRDLFIAGLEGSKFKIRNSSGTYFQLLDYSEITDEKDTDFAIRLTKEKGIASIPVSPFYHNPIDDKVLRFCFAKKEETIEAACSILQKI